MILFRQKISTSTEAHALHFFFSQICIFIYIIRYGSLSQFVLRHHTGKRGEGGTDGWRTEALIEVEKPNIAGILRC